MNAIEAQTRKVLRATLVTDGSSDTVLIPPLRWLVSELSPTPFELRWADLRSFPRPPKTLAERMTRAIALFPCDLLFVHRDAEKEPPEMRHLEIADAVAAESAVAHVAVVPVRMQEAWMLHDAAAVRQAAGRPSGTENLPLPSTSKVESLPNPKQVLYDALTVAHGATGRRAKKFNHGTAAHHLADLISDWTPLTNLAAFRRLTDDTRAALTILGLSTAGAE